MTTTMAGALERSGAPALVPPCGTRSVEPGGRLNVTDDAVRQHMEHAIARGLPNVSVGHDRGAAVVCALGPSLSDHIELVRAMKGMEIPVLACKDAVNVLARHDVIADYAVFVDGQSHQLAYLDNPPAGTEYLLGSMCHPAMFDRLIELKRDVRLWHSWPDSADLFDLVPKGQDHLVVAGGTTTGLRTIRLAYAMGLDPLYLVGFDGCIREDGTHHANVPQQFDARIFDVWCAGRTFKVNHALANQQIRFVETLERWREHTARLIFVGDGLLAHTYQQVMAHPKGWALSHRRSGFDLFADSGDFDLSFSDDISNQEFS